MNDRRPTISRAARRLSFRLSLALLCLPSLAVAAPQKNPVADWNELLTSCIARQCQTPALASRNLATFHLAISAAIDTARGLPAEEQMLAAAAAAAAAAQTLFPAEAARFGKLVAEREARSTRTAMIDAGRRAAAAAMATRRGDAETTTVNYRTSFASGQWQRTSNRPPELPHWPSVRPFVLREPKAFLPPPPPVLGSAEYAKALHEVQTLGGADSVARTKEQTMLAKFWSDFSYTSTPPGHWNEVARFLSRENALDLETSARLFTALNVAIADAAVVCWQAKYSYNFWRPVTAIRNADDDGNRATHSYAEWKPLLTTPPHPEYISGHAAFSAAAARVMEEFFGEGTEFRVTSETVPGVERSYASFAGCAAEIAESRVHGGIHFRFSGQAGLVVGRAVAESILQTLGSRKGDRIALNTILNP